MVSMKQSAWLFFLGAALSLPSVSAVAQGGKQTTSRSASGKSVTKEVFPPPPAEVLKEITQPELRAELLRMVSDDQIARSAST